MITIYPDKLQTHQPSTKHNKKDAVDGKYEGSRTQVVVVLPMSPTVRTCLLLLACCLLITRECRSNPLPERNPPYALEQGGSEVSQIQEENEGDPLPRNDTGANNLRYGEDNRLIEVHQHQNNRKAETSLEHNVEIQDRSYENQQDNQTNANIDISREQIPDQVSSLEQNATTNSSRNEQLYAGHPNIISIHRNDSESGLQGEVLSHGISTGHRDQSSNLNFGPPNEHQVEQLPIVKRTVIPALFPETQNESIPLATHSPVAGGGISQSEIVHENDTHLQGHLEHENIQTEVKTTRPANVLSSTLSPEGLHSNLILPDTDSHSVNILEPGVDTEGNETDIGNFNETFITNKPEGRSMPPETVPLATIRIPAENHITELHPPTNVTEDNLNPITVTREPSITKESKYRTKDQAREVTLPIKDHEVPEIVSERSTFPQISSTEATTSASQEYIRELSTTTRLLPVEVVSTILPPKEPTPYSTLTTRLPTEQIIIVSTTYPTIPQEQLPTEKVSSSSISSSRGVSYTRTTPSNEEVRETGTSSPPSEAVPEITIRYPTEQVNPEPTEPTIRTSTRAIGVTETKAVDGGRSPHPEGNVPHVPLRIPTEPAEIPSTTVLPEINSNNKASSTAYEVLTEKIAGKTDKGSHVLVTELSTIGTNTTLSTLSSQRTANDRYVHVTTTASEELRSTFYSTVQGTSTEIKARNSSESREPVMTTNVSNITHNGTSTTTFSNINKNSTSLPVSQFTEIYSTSSERLADTVSTTVTKSSTDQGLTSDLTSQPRTIHATQQATLSSKIPLTTNVRVTSEQYLSPTENNNIGSTPTSGYPPIPHNTSIEFKTPTTQQKNISVSGSTNTTTLSPSTPSLTPRNATTRWPNATSRSTTKKERTNAPTTKKPTETPKATEKPDDNVSPALIVPPVYISLQFLMTLNEFCSDKSTFIKDLTEIIRRKNNKDFEERQIKFINQLCYERASNHITVSEHIENDLTRTIVTVDIYVTDVKGQIDIKLTVDSSEFLKTGFKSSQSRYAQKLVNVHLINSNTNENLEASEDKGLSSGMTIAVIIVIIGGICCVCLIVIQILMHKRNEKGSRSFFPGSNRFSLRSLDSIALNAVPKSRPHSGFWNPGLDHSEENISSSLSNPMGFNSLSNMTRDMVEIYKEFEKLPHGTPNLSAVPIGAEDKNRFANVIPISHSRVKLQKLPHEEHSDYINANFVTGYRGDVHAYIATQAPLSNTIGDFWRMVWEQQSRVIIMLMAVNETAQPRDPSYVPDTEGVNGRVRYGDLVLVLKKKEVRQEYIMSLLEVKDIEHNLVREVRHFWFTSWSVDTVPEPISVIKLILDTRVHYEDSGAPVIVHCSSGTGRTGTLIAIDICMRSYESKRVVDILSCASNMRKERAGVVQNKEQYALIYKTLNEYAVIMGSPKLAQSSSNAIQLQHML